MKNRFATWKYPSILLIGVGVSNVGEWIYFIALNLIVLEMTGSPLAVSALYMIKPLATLFTNFWAGTFVDRLNKKYLMIFLDIFRAIIIFILPLVTSLVLIYLIVFLINMASSIFEPTSMTYVTKLIPKQKRKRFNSLYSLITSGAFLTGPAISGTLFLIGSPMLAIYTNAIALLVSGLITFFMPNVEKKSSTFQPLNKLSFKVIKADWESVIHFARVQTSVMVIYLLFSCIMVIMASAVDSLEAAFATEVLSLRDSEYGFLVSIAGAGIVVGAFINYITVNSVKISYLIGLGTLFVSIGYMIYAFSNTFIFAAIGFFTLAFFIAFANTGFLTFYQNNIPVEMMGRIRSIFSLVEALLIIILTGILGLVAQLVSVESAVQLGVIFMLIISVFLLVVSLLPSKEIIFQSSVNP
ncbi:MFS transporter [Alkalibacillus silvisoli]|uniref:MFS transporter n=1 Tax=Alkalibacillus silvisoli TaxID=392823 RepID=A0ABP3JRY2_9BACI